MAKLSVQLVFEYERATTGTERFKEKTTAGIRGVVGTLYMSKQFLEKAGWGIPEMLEVTIEVPDDLISRRQLKPTNPDMVKDPREYKITDENE